MASVLLGLAVSSAIALAAAGVTRSVTATSGATSATVTYLANSNSAAGPPFADVRLKITRQGSTAFDAAVRAPLCRSSCWPDSYPGHRFLAVSDIEGNGSPDVILDLYSGGAHCCSIVQVYRYDSERGRYAIFQRDFWDPGARLERLHGIYEFLSADYRFAYEFTSFAFSGLPLAIWHFGAHGFVNVTRRFPALIALDAARQYRAFLANRKQGFGLGFIAAWAADEDLLGHGALVASTLATQNREGDLRSADSPVHGSTFIVALKYFLARHGYVR